MLKASTLKILAVIFLMTLTAQLSSAQNKILCGQDIILKKLEENYPGYKKSADKTFTQTKNSIAVQKTSTPSYTINVVVHVVWKDPSENLADSIIQSQIDVLNEDYNRLNPDTGNLRSFFSPIAGNANIHFNLSQVIRKQTTTDFNISLSSSSMPSEMKHDAQGGSDAVDPQHYLNLWICKIQPITWMGITIGQVLGFAFPPNNLSNWPANSGAPDPSDDGVVIDFRCIGRNNPNPIDPGTGSALNIRGRTPTHEVGHYLGLRHIWGDGQGFGSGNNCTGNDGIDDTPKADNQSNFDCDTTKNTCVDTLQWTAADAPDLIENYMDYSAETCMNMFSAGQVAHMQATLAGPRNDLVNGSVAVKAVSAMKEIRMFPNPAKEQITFDFGGQAVNRIEICNVMGAVVLSASTINSDKLQINISNLNEGSYIAKVFGTNNVQIKKIIVAKL